MKVRIVTALVIVTMLVGGCSTGSPTARSSKNYCAVVAKHKDRYLSAMSAASSTNAITGLLSAIGAIGDLQNMWTELAQVAPEEIRVDTEAVKTAWDKIQDASLNHNYVKAASVALTNMGPSRRVNTYISKTCGPEYAPGGSGDTQPERGGGPSQLLGETRTWESKRVLQATFSSPDRSYQG